MSQAGEPVLGTQHWAAGLGGSCPGNVLVLSSESDKWVPMRPLVRQAHGSDAPQHGDYAPTIGLALAVWQCGYRLCVQPERPLCPAQDGQWGGMGWGAPGHLRG